MKKNIKRLLRALELCNSQESFKRLGEYAIKTNLHCYSHCDNQNNHMCSGYRWKEEKLIWAIEEAAQRVELVEPIDPWCLDELRVTCSPLLSTEIFYQAKTWHEVPREVA